MKTVIILIMLSAFSSETIFDKENTNENNWFILDDVVMGGRSQGQMKINDEGICEFYGLVSTANNGGFSSVRYRLESTSTSPSSVVKIKLKGDGKRYQFRVKSNSNDYYSYITYFKTSGKWEEIEIPMNEMYPSFRGRKLDFPNFDKDQIQELSFLIANKKNEEFKLLISNIEILN